MIYIIETPSDKISANGTDNQIPSEPIIRGNMIKLAIKNTKVRKNEMIAEILPFENAVNILEAKILTPVNK